VTFAQFALSFYELIEHMVSICIASDLHRADSERAHCSRATPKYAGSAGNLHALVCCLLKRETNALNVGNPMRLWCPMPPPVVFHPIIENVGLQVDRWGLQRIQACRSHLFAIFP
jgi:hypothetical protein